MTAPTSPVARVRHSISVQPRRVLITAVLATIVCIAVGIIGGRAAAPHAAPATVSVAPITAAPAGDPIVRPERLELPK